MMKWFQDIRKKTGKTNQHYWLTDDKNQNKFKNNVIFNPFFWLLLGLTFSLGSLLFFFISLLSSAGIVNVVFIGAGYETNINISENYEGKRVLGSISSWMANYSSIGITQVGPIIRPTRDTHFVFPQINSKSKVAIVMISMALDLDEKGLFLIKDDANPRDDGKGKIRFDAIIEEMGKLPNKMHKLIILHPISNNNTLGRAGLGFFLNNEIENEKIEAVPNLNVVIAKPNNSNIIEDDIFGTKSFWNKMIALLWGTEDLQNTSKYFGIFGVSDAKLKISSENIEKEMGWYPSGKEGEVRANKTFSLIPKVYSKPNFENLFLINDFNQFTKEVWSTFRELKNGATSPVVYAPELWREYEKTCIRLEVLKKQGAVIEADQLTLDMKQLEKQIVERRKLKLISETNGFQYMWVEGVPAEEELIAKSIFQNLEKGNFPAIKEHFDGLKKEGYPDFTRRRIAFFLVQRILEAAILSPQTNLEKKLEDLLALLDTDAFYPNEIQTGLILKPKNKNSVKSVGNIKASEKEFENILKLKIDSEKASFGLVPNVNFHPYIEKIWPYISKIIKNADVARSLSQDYSFSSSESDLKLHRDLQRQAELLYSRANNTSKTFQLAFNMRDNLASDLPWLTHWLILANPIFNLDYEDANYNWGGEIKKLWETYHKLNNYLTSLPTPQVIDNKDLTLEFEFEFQESQLEELNTRVAEAGKMISEIKDKLTNLALRVVADESIKSWLLVTKLLETPFFSIELRSKLLTHQSKIEKFILNKKQGYSMAGNHPGMGGEVIYYKATLSNFDFWLSSFGKGIRKFSPDQIKNLDLVSELYEKLKLATTNNDILHLVKMAKMEIRKSLFSDEDLIVNLANFITANRPKDFQNGLLTSYSSLKESDAIERTFPWVSLENKVNDSSVSLMLRQSEIRDFLCWQAFRTWNDHLFSLEENKDPYYLNSINQILLDIKRFQGPSDITRVLKKVLDRSSVNAFRIKNNPELISGYSGEVPWTFEKTRPIAIGASFLSENNVLNGKIAIGVKVSDNLIVTDKAWEILSPRLVNVQNQGGIPSPQIINLERRNMVLGKLGTEVGMTDFRCFFRGKVFYLNVPIEIRNQADIVNQEFASFSNGNISFRSSANLDQVANGIGSISFVLDCSGSMGPSGDSPIEESKYFQAVAALDQVLSKIPQGTKISVWIFGQAVGGGKTVIEPEDNIVQIIKPLIWDPYKPNNRNIIISKLKYPTVEPWNTSPIVRAMSFALEDLAKSEGAKMMVVLTDGLDNRIKKDKVLNPEGKSASSVLYSLFNAKNVQVQVIGFRAVPEEEEEMKTQFSILEQIDPPGNFVSLNSIDALTARINRFLSPSASVRIEDLNNFKPEGLENKTLEISKLGSGDRWIPKGLKPGFYNSKLKEYPAINKDIKLEHNDRLVIGIAKSKSMYPLEFTRLLISETDYARKPAIEKQGWRSAVLANKMENQNCRLFAVLEKRYDSKEVLFSQIKPREVWWELKTKNKDSNMPAFRVSKFQEFPAPAWTIDSLQWPRDPANMLPSLPKMSLWWNSDQETPFISKLDKGVDFNKWSDLEGKTIQIDGRNIMISSCSVQTCNLINKQGFVEPQKCMVISVIHPLDMSIMIKLEGLNIFNSETYWFKGSGQTNLVLWPVENSPPLPSGIIFSSVDRMKKAAESRGMFIEFSDLSLPDPNDSLPMPILNFP